MINLLPPEEKEKLILDMKKKILTVILFLFLFFLICFILILLSVRIYQQGQIESQKIIFQETEKTMVKTQNQDLMDKIKNFNDVFVKIDNFYRQKIYFSGILGKISQIIPKEAYLTEIRLNFGVGENSDIEALLSGFIPDREMLFSLKKTLEQESFIKDVYFPPVNWIDPIDISFFINFKIPQSGN